MKDKKYLKDLHIGKIIREIARQRNVPAKTLADAVTLYQSDNADKIYLLDDMDCENIVKLSCLLKYNILDVIAKKYLSHLPLPDYVINAESRLIKFDIENRQIMIYNPFDNLDFLAKIYIGQYIKRAAERRKWKEKDTAKHLNCSQGAVSNLYKSKSLRVKPLIQLSEDFQHNFIAEAYLSQMTIVSSFHLTDGCIVSLSPLPQVRIKNPNDETFYVVFKQNED